MVGKRSPVMLFVSGLPEKITSRELKMLVRRVIKKTGIGWFSLKTTVSNCAILRITDRSNGTAEHHGLVEVQPARAAMRVVEELNGTDFNGSRILVRRYHHRSLLRDRRKSSVASSLPDSRRTERRRKHLNVDLVNAVPSSSDCGSTEVRRKDLEIDFVGT